MRDIRVGPAGLGSAVLPVAREGHWDSHVSTSSKAAQETLTALALVNA